MIIKRKRIMLLYVLCMIVLLQKCAVSPTQEFKVIAENVNIDSYSIYDFAIVKSIISINNPPIDDNLESDEKKMKNLLKKISENMDVKYENCYQYLKYPFISNEDSGFINIWRIHIQSLNYSDDCMWCYEYIYDGVSFVFRLHSGEVILDSILNDQTMSEKMPIAEQNRIFGNHGEYYKISSIVIDTAKQEYGKEIWPTKESNEYPYSLIRGTLKHAEINHLKIMKGNQTICEYTTINCYNLLTEYIQKNNIRWPSWKIEDPPRINDEFLWIALRSGNYEITISKNPPQPRIEWSTFEDKSLSFQIERITREIHDEIAKMDSNYIDIRQNRDNYSSEDYIGKLKDISAIIDNCDNFLIKMVPVMDPLTKRSKDGYIRDFFNIYGNMMKNDTANLNRLQNNILREIDREIDYSRYKNQIYLAMILFLFSLLLSTVSLLVSLLSYCNKRLWEEIKFFLKYKLKKFL